MNDSPEGNVVTHDNHLHHDEPAGQNPSGGIAAEKGSPVSEEKTLARDDSSGKESVSHNEKAGEQYNEKAGGQYNEKGGHNVDTGNMTKAEQKRMELEGAKARSQVLENPLAFKSNAELQQMAEELCVEGGMPEHIALFQTAALLAAHPNTLDEMDISEEDKRRIKEEKTHKWRQPWSMYYIAIISSMAAVVQGMDETVVNGAQELYYPRFNIENNTNIQGLVNSAPYLCCAAFACWLNAPLNHYLGRRGTIFWSCVIAGVASIWEAFTYSWQQLFLARLLLGIGIGPKSSTAPIYTAECAPAPIRGALVMQWQVWTAFGIMLGYIVDLIFISTITDNNVSWRLMLGSTVVAPIIVCVMIYFGPESPRWYLKKHRPADAFKAMCRLRWTPLQAARDIFYMHSNLVAEASFKENKNLFHEFFFVARNRRAAQSAGLVMFMQQFCGVNVIAYYSTSVFRQSGFSLKNAIAAGLGFGVLNWLFAFPAIRTIDTFGRRNLLLVTFPLMALFLLMTGFSFFIPQDANAMTTGDYNPARVAVTALGIYLYTMCYSPGEGPVPFTYSAEAFPLYIREFGMGYATAITWMFNFVLSISFPSLLAAFKPQGAFGFYAAWCMIGWTLILFFLPETKGLTLEELDSVFSVPSMTHASYQMQNAKWHFNKWILRKKQEPLPPLYKLSEKLIAS